LHIIRIKKSLSRTTFSSSVWREPSIYFLPNMYTTHIRPISVPLERVSLHMLCTCFCLSNLIKSTLTTGIFFENHVGYDTKFICTVWEVIYSKCEIIYIVWKCIFLGLGIFPNKVECTFSPQSILRCDQTLDSILLFDFLRNPSMVYIMYHVYKLQNLKQLYNGCL